MCKLDLFVAGDTKRMANKKMYSATAQYILKKTIFV